MASLSKIRGMQEIIRGIEQKLPRRQLEHLQISHNIELLKQLAVPQGGSETVDAPVEWGEYPDCTAPGGKYRFRMSLSSYVDFL
jgi:hypothetical protein